MSSRELIVSPRVNPKCPSVLELECCMPIRYGHFPLHNTCLRHESVTSSLADDLVRIRAPVIGLRSASSRTTALCTRRPIAERDVCWAVPLPAHVWGTNGLGSEVGGRPSPVVGEDDARVRGKERKKESHPL